MEFVQYILSFILLLGVLVVIHECGHFWVARRSGVHVVRFSVGFGKPLLSRVDKHGTEFVLAAIPFGGYVQMYDDRDPLIKEAAVPNSIPDDAVGLMQISPYARIAISLAGPVANFIFAIVLYAGLFMAGSLQPIPLFTEPSVESPLARSSQIQGPFELTQIDDRDVRSFQDVAMGLSARMGESGNISLSYIELLSGDLRQADIAIEQWHKGESEPDLFGSLGLTPTRLSIAGRVLEGSAAERAGIEAGDWFIAVDGQSVGNWSEWVAEFRNRPGESVVFTLIRDGRQYNITAVPDSVVSEDGEEVGQLGVGPARVEVSYPIVQAVSLGASKTLDMSVMTVSMMGKMLAGSVSAENLVGPVGIAKIAGDSVRIGWDFFFGIMALMSISLGVLNLLPIPMLDGGHVVLTLVEIIKGSPLSERLQVAFFQGGLLLVLMTFVFVTFNDIARLF